MSWRMDNNIKADEVMCLTCEKAWTDDCPKHKCWENEFSEYVKEEQQGDNT